MEEQKGEVRTYAPEEVSSTVLGAIKKYAQGRLNKEVNKCIVTVPANFNDN